MSKPAENFARRDRLLEIQADMQRKWESAKLFEVDAPAPGEPLPPEGRFFGNFPYPYMNGLLHLGHAFSISKLEFASAYNRVLGKRVMFPQAFHCTGMPIKACADKLDGEIKRFGLPPQFPVEEKVEEPLPEAAPQGGAKADPTKFSGKKSKAAAKQGTQAWQWQILEKSGIPSEEIPKFRVPAYWLEYFPPLAKRDLTLMGCGIDWRRSFITTDMNPYYDSFIQWQFRTLKAKGKVVKDKRYAVFSPLDGQPCADHDRASGEGAGPQEYTLIKMEAIELNGKLKELEGHGRVFLVAATLRPETMYGQTNCWVLPEGKYGAYKGLDNEVYVLTARAARNLAYQEKLPKHGEPELLLELTGQDLIGTPVKSPHCPHERVYVLPLLTILTNKGTGVVTSVPSDSPDDYTALEDLKKKPKLREKYGVKDEWVLPFEVIPIIEIPGYGTTAAVKVCQELNVQSQNDKEKLEKAKNEVYNKGFSEGVMQVGPYAGQKVSVVKPIIKKEMIEAGQAILYSEPERQVISRSGDECVVALTDQWYMIYGEEEWRKATEACLASMELYAEETRNGFQHCLGWLQQWACSRSFGLGTRLPWDPQYLIESLSDSTIYMAFYTIAHILQEGDMYGKTKAAITPEQLTDEVWDYIFGSGAVPTSSGISEDLLKKMKAEFEFWYPFDLRVSGKDLIQNHLTFCLYNHTALFPESKWPRGFRTNGHLQLNSEKMSKSTGNFKTLHEAIGEFSADAMRWALADAGDGMDDANFETSTASASILRITKELGWTEEMLAPGASLRDGPVSTLHDKVFENEINIAVHQAKKAYDTMLFREALKIAGYNLSNARDVYRFACGEEGMNKALVLKYIEVSTALLAPIIPHTSDYVWTVLLKKPSTVLCGCWPEAGAPDFVMQRAAQFVEDKFIPNLRKLIQKAEAPPKKKGNAPVVPVKATRADVFVSTKFAGWQEAVLRGLQQSYDPATTSKLKPFTDDVFDTVVSSVKQEGSLSTMNEKQLKAAVMPFCKFKMEEAGTAGPQVLDVKLPYDENQLLVDNTAYLLRNLKLETLNVHDVSDAAAVAAVSESAKVKIDITQAYPGSPLTYLTTQPVS